MSCAANFATARRGGRRLASAMALLAFGSAALAIAMPVPLPMLPERRRFPCRSPPTRLPTRPPAAR
jgi:hypothetical protein